MIESGGPVGACAVNLGQAVIRGSSPCSVPGALVEGVVVFLLTFQIRERQAERVVRLAIRRIGIARGEAGEGSTKMLLSMGEFAAVQVPPAQGEIAAAVARVA